MIRNKENKKISNGKNSFSIEAIKNKDGFYKIVVMISKEDVWEKIPLRLTFTSYFKAFFRNELWPPSSYDDFYFNENRDVCVKFHELISMDAIIPKSTEHPCEWIATYNPKSRKWNLEKIRFLNLEPGEPYL